MVAIAEQPPETRADGAEIERRYKAWHAEQCAERAKRIEGVMSRGGLPGGPEADELDEQLGECLSILQEFAADIDVVAESVDGADLPFSVTLEHYGAVALIVNSVRGRLDDMRDEVARIDKRLLDIDCLRQAGTSPDSAGCISL